MSPPLKCTNVWCLSLFLSIVLVGSNLSNIRVGWDPFSDNTHLLILHPRRITTVDWVSTRFQPLSQYRDHAPFFTNRIAENASRKTIFLTFNRIVTRFVRTITIDWPSLISLNTISSIAQFKIEYCDCREEETACLHVEHSTTNILATIRYIRSNKTQDRACIVSDLNCKSKRSSAWPQWSIFCTIHIIFYCTSFINSYGEYKVVHFIHIVTFWKCSGRPVHLYYVYILPQLYFGDPMPGGT
eukprot:537623_1